MANILKYITAETVEKIREEIEQSNGNEVFFLGFVDEDLIVADVQVAARGNRVAVPAIRQLAQEADVVIHNHPSGFLQPSHADLGIAAALQDFSVAFYIINNSVDDLYAVIEPFKKTESVPLNMPHLERLLQPGGTISRNMPTYEDRPQQIEMIDTVVKAFNDSKVACIEAGTGTGKTMAYLLPAIYWSTKNKERVVISTNTINLQEQLIKKDIPFLRKALDIEFEAVLVKGRSNYACLRKVDEVEAELELDAEEDYYDDLKSLVGWAKQAKEGSKADLAIIPKPHVWEKIASESDTCTRSRCPHFQQCFVNKARRTATRANILVVNHHLLFADLALRMHTGSIKDAAVLPPYSKIIFDEAHHIENVATSYFGSQITRAGLVRFFSRLHRKQKGRDKGLLHKLRFKAYHHKKSISDSLLQELVTKINSQLVHGCEELSEQAHSLMDNVFSVLKSRNGGQLDFEHKVRLLPQVQEELFYATGLRAPLEDFIDTLVAFSGDLESLLALAKKCGQQIEDPSWDSSLIEIKAQAERIAGAADTLKQVCLKNSDDTIRWIEAKPGWRGMRNIVRFQISPLEIRDTMNTGVYEMFDTIVMTSATLTVDKKFDFLGERIGLDLLPTGRLLELMLDSPFDYQSQVLLAIPQDMPDPRHASFSKELSKAVFKAISITEGHAFVLFTSYGLLNMVFRELESNLDMINIRAFKQGAEQRHELIKRFKRDKQSVLFGTDSFWEGVDVEGEALQSVIITKLPFRVPSEPVIEARYEAIEKNGGNAFMDYAVPLAVLKFKQGFGRLIRRKSDRGCVVIFDNRVIQKSYGKRFIRSLPECKIAQGTREQVFDELKRFFY